MSTHVKIVPYKIVAEEGGKKMRLQPETSVTFRQVAAGYNHSMAVTRQGRVYTWGYSGFSVLGRTKEVQNVPIAIESGLAGRAMRFFVKVPAKDPLAAI